MVFRRKSFNFLVLLAIAVLILSACERPAPGGTESTPVPTVDPNIGGGTDGSQQPEPGSEQPQPAPEGGEPGGEQPQPAPEGGEQPQPAPEGGEQPQPAPEGGEQPQPAPEGGEQVGDKQPEAPPPAGEGQPAQGGQAGVQPTQEVTHVVQPGENLFRIGLHYGYSWTVLARYNGIPNPNYIYVGQPLRIPPASGGTGGLPVDGNYTYYVVQPGENLFRIGLRFGLSWTLIAEANGIVNPHYIVTGQVLKIPIYPIPFG